MTYSIRILETTVRLDVSDNRTDCLIVVRKEVGKWRGIDYVYIGRGCGFLPLYFDVFGMPVLGPFLVTKGQGGSVAVNCHSSCGSTAAAIRMAPHPDAYGLAFLILPPKYQSKIGVGIPTTTPASANTEFPHP